MPNKVCLNLDHYWHFLFYGHMIIFDFLVSLRSKIDNMKTIYTKGLYNEYIARIKIKGIYARKIYFLLSILSDVAQDMFLEGFK